MENSRSETCPFTEKVWSGRFKNKSTNISYNRKHFKNEVIKNAESQTQGNKTTNSIFQSYVNKFLFFMKVKKVDNNIDRLYIY